MECSDHIFITVKIYTCFPANAAVYLRKQSGRYLDKINPPQISSGRIASQIAHNAAPQGYEHIFSVKMV